MLELTERAVEHVKKIRAESGSADRALRIAVAAGGCSGFTYELSFDSEASKDDIVLELDGVRVLVDPMSNQYLNGTRIDYVTKSAYEAGFQFENPQVTAECGCGKSFSTN